MTGAPDARERPVFRASAPGRLDFAGGWTDLPPFSDAEGGAVVNAAISLRVRAEYEPGGTGILVRAEDLNQAALIAGAAELVPDGRLDLHKAALRMFPVGPGTLRTRSDVPAGSGLGESAALDVALVALLAAARGDALTPEEIASHAWYLATVEAGIAGGRQDQYAAALGGFHRLTFRGDVVGVKRLELDAAFLQELERRLVVCYTGSSPVSGDTIPRVMAGYSAGDPTITGALRELSALAGEMAAALGSANLAETGRLLSANWRAQQQLDSHMGTEEMRRLEALIAEAGGLGGKAAGAGGCMFFLAGNDVDAARRAARQAGATVLEAGWSHTGVEWC